MGAALQRQSDLSDCRILHRIDLVGNQLTYLPTTIEKLRDASFLDGRSTFWTAPPQRASLDSALAQTRVPTAARYIFHGSFCGSMLLTRLLEACTTALIVREPQCLVDIADARSARGRLTTCDDDLRTVSDFAAASLTSLGEPGRPVVIKPSNWVNNLVPALCSAAGARPLFITMERRAFLRGVFRGGRERLVFTARVAAHLAATVSGGGVLVSAAIAAPDPLQQVARLAALAHRLQERIFASEMAAGAWDSRHCIDFSTIVAEPGLAVERAAATLGLATDGDDIRRKVAMIVEKDAKRPGTAFSGQQRANDDGAVDAAHGDLIAAATSWADELTFT